MRFDDERGRGPKEGVERAPFFSNRIHPSSMLPSRIPVLTTVRQVRQWRQAQRALEVGFVPTMGSSVLSLSSFPCSLASLPELTCFLSDGMGWADSIRATSTSVRPPPPLSSLSSSPEELTSCLWNGGQSSKAWPARPAQSCPSLSTPPSSVLLKTCSRIPATCHPTCPCSPLSCLLRLTPLRQPRSRRRLRDKRQT